MLTLNTLSFLRCVTKAHIISTCEYNVMLCIERVSSMAMGKRYISFSTTCAYVHWFYTAINVRNKNDIPFSFLSMCGAEGLCLRKSIKIFYRYNEFVMIIKDIGSKIIFFLICFKIACRIKKLDDAF